MNKIIIKNNEELKKYCTFHIGGIAKKVVIVFSNKQLIDSVKTCVKNNEKFKVIGLGANLLFSSKGYAGTIIVNRAKYLKFLNTHAYASSGLTISELINKCLKKGLSNLEKLSGIPSTIGGAITNNLGSFGVEICDFVECVYCFKLPDLKTKLTLNKSQCGFSYRNSIFKDNSYIIIGAKFSLKEENIEEIRKAINSTLRKKCESQPTNEFSAGSVFKRTDIIPAKIIDELELKGTKIGDAEISKKHAGFIINKGNASSNDVLKLIELIKNKVKEKYNSTLELEIEIVE